jgi:hypothetical protein
MTYLNQIRALETELIMLAELKAPMVNIELKLVEMKTVTEKYLGITNEYLEDNKG